MAAAAAPIRFQCPQGHELSVAPQHAGRQAACPHCGEPVTVPKDTVPQQQDTAPKDTIPQQQDTAPQQQATSAPATIDESGSSKTGNVALPPLLTPADFADSPPPAIIRWQDPDAPLVSFVTEQTPRFEPDSRHRRRGYLLAIAQGILAFALAASAGDALLTAGAPWAWLLLGLSSGVVLYIIGSVSLPDWSTVWLGQLVFAAVALVHLAAAATIAFSSADPRPLQLPTGTWPLLFCGLVAVYCTALVIGCHLVCRPWRAEYDAFTGVLPPEAPSPSASPPAESPLNTET